MALYKSTFTYLLTYLLPIEVLHCGNREFHAFSSCDLDLDAIIFIYEFDPCLVKMSRQTTDELQGFRKYTYRHTWRQMPLKKNYHAASIAGGKSDHFVSKDIMSRWQTVDYSVSQKKVAPLKLFAIFSLRLSIFL